MKNDLVEEVKILFEKQLKELKEIDAMIDEMIEDKFIADRDSIPTNMPTFVIIGMYKIFKSSKDKGLF